MVFGVVMPLSDLRRRILIVDDAPAVAESLALIFSREGLDVRVAHSAEDAIELISNWEPHAAFIDIMLPGVNGIEFAKLLKTRHPDCEASLMSGHPATVELVENARRQGRPMHVLPKPFDPARFVAIACGLTAADYEDEAPYEIPGAPGEPAVPPAGTDPLPGVAPEQRRAVRKHGDGPTPV